MSTSNIIRVVQTTLIAIGLAFGISVVVAGHWWSDKIHLDLDALGKQVTSSLQNQFDSTDDTKKLHFRVGSDLTLINVTGNGNEYHGMVTVHTRKFASVPVVVTVYADDTGRWMWELEPASKVQLMTTAEQEQER